MSENTSLPERDDQAAPENAPPPVAHANPVADLVARISLTHLALAVLAAIFIWQWLDGRRAISDMQQQLAQKIAEAGVASRAGQILLTQDQDQMRELSARVMVLETRIAELQNRRAARDALSGDQSASRIETVLAEIEQTLLMAEQQLQLSGNVKAALIAIQSVDARLQRMNRPAFNGMRKAIGEDMEKLRVLPGVDITGINIQLNELVAAVDRLPLAYQQHAPGEAVAQTIPKDETAWQKLLREIWQEAKQLVRIENTGMEKIPLLMPDQEFFLRENLKLHLLSARIALLSRDENSFSRELKTVQLWTSRYFDGKSGETMRMLAGLKKLAATDVGIAVPDIGASLQAVRNYRLTHEKAAR